MALNVGSLTQSDTDIAICKADLSEKITKLIYASFGDIMKVETIGASLQTAQQDNLEFSGKFLSGHHTIMAQTDAGRIKRLRFAINRVAVQHGISPALIAAIISRESHAGNTIRNTKGRGDNDRTFGLVQVDVNPKGDGQTAQGTWDSEEHLSQATGNLASFIGRIRLKFPHWSKEQQLKGGITAYNAGDGNIHSYENVDAHTTGGDYSRAQWYKSNCSFCILGF
ncbi:lysozyme g-like [Cheilinus undulatus]|uniref:lysozyme g-like n=1 Tax=Cheilinus undulatus TaxID=241271 RepID=UPI001BD3FE6F|nr:lysozyme g-like [Cheilinus undulatus]